VPADTPAAVTLTYIFILAAVSTVVTIVVEWSYNAVELQSNGSRIVIVTAACDLAAQSHRPVPDDDFSSGQRNSERQGEPERA